MVKAVAAVVFVVGAVAAWPAPVVRRPWAAGAPTRRADGVASGWLVASLEHRLARAEIARGRLRTAIEWWSATAAAAGAVGLVAMGAPGLVGGLVAGVTGPPALVVVRGDRRRRRLVAGLPEFCDLVARSLRSGAGLGTALGEAGAAVPAVAGSVQGLLARSAAGMPLERALDRWAVEVAHPDATLVATVLTLGRVSGGALARPLERAAATLRERRELADEVAALTAQTRSSALVVALTPLVFAVLAARTDPEVGRVFTSTAVGRLCLVGGVLFDLAGLWWMRRLTRPRHPRWAPTEVAP
ncbi:MAG: hypothetical protein D6683_16605 [Actinomyces sp.]|nr:MAG: hypothetical protein D6683_16605 [Actinomyces sp.]